MGLVFKECPPTDGYYYDGPFDGAKLSEQNELNFHQGRLEGQTWGTLERPALNLHPNLGITLDLEHIRYDDPGFRLSRFRSWCGMSETTKKGGGKPVTFWVLVDGRVRFQHLCTGAGGQVGSVDLPIGPTDRFLTLVATTPGDSGYCWGFFAEPMLELAPEEGF